MTGLGGFFRDSRSRGVIEEDAVPRAIRPAVEIIARLSAERNKLREEVGRLREMVRKAPRPDDLARVRAERDALARELAVLKAQAAEQRRDEDRSGLPVELVERLERAVARIEAAPSTARTTETVYSPAPSTARTTETVYSPAPAPAPTFTRTASTPQPAFTRPSPSPLRAPRSRPTAAPPPAPQERPVRRPAPRGGGMLAGLVKQNVSLRSDVAPRKATPTRDTARATFDALEAEGRRALTRRPSAPPPPPPSAPSPNQSTTARGGGLLHGLFSQNLSLRGPGKNT